MNEIIQKLLEEFFSSHSFQHVENSTPPIYVIGKESLVEVSKILLENKKTYFDQLTCITGVDENEEMIGIIYHLYSIPFNHKIGLQCFLSKENPRIDSVTNIWKTAEWHEREAYDMMGIEFNNHPDLRRILMPNDWEGFPLRKNYKQQETYHNIKTSWSNPK